MLSPFLKNNSSDRIQDRYIQNYKLCLNEKRFHIVHGKEIIYFNEVFCNNHNDSINKMYNTILNAHIDPRWCITHLSGMTGPNRMPEWNEFVSNYYGEVLWWHRSWIQAGWLLKGNIPNMMHVIRSVYHRQIKKGKNPKSTISNDRMANALYTNINSDLSK